MVKYYYNTSRSVFDRSSIGSRSSSVRESKIHRIDIKVSTDY